MAYGLLASNKKAPCGKMFAAGRVCYVSAFEKRLCYAITENTSQNDQRKSNQQKA